MTEEEKQQRWLAAWKVAGPELERIRKQELRLKDEGYGLKSLGAFSKTNSEINGLVIFQAWMMRMRVIELTKQLIARELTPLAELKESPEILEQLEQVFLSEV